MTEATPAPAKSPEPSKPKLSPELDALDGLIRMSFEEKKAPAQVIAAWDNFLSECAKWEAEQKASTPVGKS